MNKHIAGFILFSFIIGMTAFIYAMFNIVRLVEVPAPTYSQTYSSKTSCWKMKRQLRESNFGSPVIEQAVFNLKTKRFSWKLAAPETDLPIALHFFVKDKNGIRYISTEQDINSVRYKELNFSSSFIWIDNLDSYANLYVMAELVPTSRRYNKNFQPEFDVSRAAPVLLYSGDQG
jgi:hypothetical protein